MNEKLLNIVKGIGTLITLVLFLPLALITIIILLILAQIKMVGELIYESSKRLIDKYIPKYPN